jgi:YD repeat-containing protein
LSSQTVRVLTFPVNYQRERTALLRQFLTIVLSLSIAVPAYSNTYDANGNTAASTGQGYVYDFENHLIQTGGVTYTYDGDGNRISKTVAGVTTTYLLDTESPTGYTQVVQEWVSSGNPSAYAYGLEQISR